MSTTDDDYSKVAEEIEQLAKDGIVFLIPPGSRRGEVVKKLKGLGIEILVYDELYNKICNGSCDDKNIKPVGKDLSVENKDLVEYIKNGGKLKDALERKVIVHESTAEFLLLIDQIRRKLAEEITGEGKDRKKAEKGAEKIIEDRVKIYSLLNEEKLENLDEEVRKAVEVDYTSVLEGFAEKPNFIGEPKGISPKLVEKAKENPERIKNGVEAIRALDPDYIGLKDIFNNLKESAINSLVEGILSTLASVIGGNILVNLVGGVLGFTVKTLGEKFLEKIPKSILEIIIKKKKKEVIESMRELIRAVLQSKDYINDKDFEAVVDEIACKWGLSLEGFRNFISNISNAIAGKFVTEEELNKKWEEYKKELKKRLEELEREIDEIKDEVQMVSVVSVPLVFDADTWSYVKDSNEAFKLMNTLFPEADYVNTPLENKLFSELNKTARNGGGLIVLRGKKGIGKSTAATVALWRILKQNILTVEEKQEMKVYRPVIVEFGIPTRTFEIDLHQLKRFIDVAKNKGFLPIFYVDPSKIGAYDQNTYYIGNFATGLQSIIEVLKANTVLRNAIILIVLSNDQYKLVENQLKDVPSIELIDADGILEEKKVKIEILSNIIENNSSCGADIAQSLADLISERFLDNYTLVAVLVTDMLKKSKCKVEDVKKSIEDAKGQVHKFILDYIWRGVLGGDEDLVRRHVPLIIATGLFGRHTSFWGKVIIEAFGYNPNKSVVTWFTQPLHGTIYETIEKITKSTVKRAFDMNNLEDICDDTSKESCELIELCAEHLKRLGIPRAKYKDVNDVARKYMEIIIEKLMKPKLKNYIISEFMSRFGGEERNEKWEVVHKIKTRSGEKEIKSSYDEVDALLIMGYLSYNTIFPLPKGSTLYKFIKSRKLEDLFFYFPLEELIKEEYNRFEGEILKDLLFKRPYISYIYNLMIMNLESWEDIMRRAEKILKDIERNGYVSELDLLEGLEILAISKNNISFLVKEKDSKFVKALSKLSALLANSKYSGLKKEVKEFLHSVWGKRKEMSESENVAKYIADYISMVIHNPRDPASPLYIDLQYLPSRDGQPIAIRLTLGSEPISDSDKRIIIQYFNMLYETASKIGKLALLDKLFYLSSDPIKVSEYLGQQSSESLCDLIAHRVDNLLKEFDNNERNIAISLLYSGLARCYSENGEIVKAEKYAKDALDAVSNENVLKNGYEKLKEYLEVWFLRPELDQELNILRQVVYRRLSQAYLMMGRVEDADKLAHEACKITEELGEVGDMLRSCRLAFGVNVIRTGESNHEKFKKLYDVAEEQVFIDESLKDAIKAQYLISLACEGKEMVTDETSKLSLGQEIIKNLFIQLRYKLVPRIIDWKELQNQYFAYNGPMIIGPDETFMDNFKEEKNLNTALKEDSQTVGNSEKLDIKINLSNKIYLYPNLYVDLVKSVTKESSEEILFRILFELIGCNFIVGLLHCEIAETVAEIASQKAKGIEAQLFSELAKDIENKDWDAIIRNVCRLYHFISVYYH